MIVMKSETNTEDPEVKETVFEKINRANLRQKKGKRDT